MVQLNTLQIATFGSDMQEGIAAGIRNFPVHKLILLCYSTDKHKAEEFARRIRTVLGIPVTISVVSQGNVIRDVVERIGEILNSEKKNYVTILMKGMRVGKLDGFACILAS